LLASFCIVTSFVIFNLANVPPSKKKTHAYTYESVCLTFCFADKSTMSFDFSTDLSTTTAAATQTFAGTTSQLNQKVNSTATIVSDEHLFLHTVTCQTIAGAFTWAAILITGFHVKHTHIFRLCPSKRFFFRSLRRSIHIYVIIMFHRNKNGSSVYFSLCRFTRFCLGLV